MGVAEIGYGRLNPGLAFCVSNEANSKERNLESVYSRPIYCRLFWQVFALEHVRFRQVLLHDYADDDFTAFCNPETIGNIHLSQSLWPRNLPMLAGYFLQTASSVWFWQIETAGSVGPWN